MENTSATSPSETFKGEISLAFNPGESLTRFCEKIFGYNADDYEPIAIRLYYGRETIMTLYALDKKRQDTSKTDLDKLPVRKFKREISSPEELIPYVASFNLTLSAGNFPLEDMKVINT